MQIRSLGLIACRQCALLFAGIAMTATAIGALALYWAIFGLPADLEPQFDGDLPAQAQFFMAMLGGIAVVAGLFHATLSVPASLGRVWPLAAGTLFWTFLVGPLLGRMLPGAVPLTIVLPVVFASLTLTALLANQRTQRTAHASS
jgi:hypothetical protein